MSGDWEILSSDRDYERLNARGIQFRVEVEPMSQATVRYKARVKR